MELTGAGYSVGIEQETNYLRGNHFYNWTVADSSGRYDLPTCSRGPKSEGGISNIYLPIIRKYLLQNHSITYLSIEPNSTPVKVCKSPFCADVNNKLIKDGGDL